MNNIEEKPSSEIVPHRDERATVDVQELAKTIDKVWALQSSDYNLNYKKGYEIGKGHLHREDLAEALLYGTIKCLFEEIKHQINIDESLTIEKRQRRMMRANALQDAMYNQIDILKTLNFKLDAKSLQAILQGYTTSFLLLRNHDN